MLDLHACMHACSVATSSGCYLSEILTFVMFFYDPSGINLQRVEVLMKGLLAL